MVLKSNIRINLLSVLIIVLQYVSFSDSKLIKKHLNEELYSDNVTAGGS